MNTQKNTTSPSIRAEMEKILEPTTLVVWENDPDTKPLVDQILALFKTLAEEAKPKYEYDDDYSEYQSGHKNGIKDYYSNLIQRIQG